MGYQILYSGRIKSKYSTVPVRNRAVRFILFSAIVAAAALLAYNYDSSSIVPGNPLVTEQAIQCFVTGIRQDMPFLEAAREFCVYIISNG